MDGTVILKETCRLTGMTWHSAKLIYSKLLPGRLIRFRVTMSYIIAITALFTANLLHLYEITFTLESRSVGEPALPSCTFISAVDGPLPVLEVGDVRLFSHEFDDGLLQVPAAIVSSPGSDLFCKRNGGHCQNYIPRVATACT